MKCVLRWIVLVCVAVGAGTALAGTATLPAGYLPRAESQAILDKTLRVHLTPDISALSASERTTVDRLVEVGRIFEDLHEDMQHHQALAARARLLDLDRKLGSPAETQNLITLYYASKGPITRMLDNERRPILPVDPPSSGSAVYPWGVTKEEIDAFLAAHPLERASILNPRTAVRRADKESLRRDLDVLKEHPVLDTLHPGLRASLQSLLAHPDRASFYAVPYPVAYATQLLESFRLLTDAAQTIAAEDEDFANYLRNRARDLVTNDYESGDASWVAGRFKTLNAQIGAYETYDDGLYGTKTYFGLNVLVIDHARSDALRAATAQIQRLEDGLPYDPGKPHKRVRADIPVGVYDVVADFGQSRGGNTATILPNDAGPARRYGRTILLRRNIMEAPEFFEISRESYAAAVESQYAADFVPKGGSDRTLWHEVGHYLGVDRTRDGRDLDQALEQASVVFEEMKADLVSLFVAPELRAIGYYQEADLRPLYASGVRRVLLKNRPDRAQVYQTMELMQWNYFMDRGAISFDAASGRLAVHYDRFHDAVAAMLREALEIQAAGDPAAAEAFITKYTQWRDDLHERVAQSMRSSESYRFAFVTYDLLDARDATPAIAGPTTDAARR